MPVARIMTKLPLRTALGLGLAMNLLTGCDQINQLASTVGMGDDLTVAANDPCGPQRATFAKSNDFFTADVLKSAGVAGLVGAAGGAAVGGALGGQRGALTGGLVGGAGGILTSLTLSYADYMQKQYPDNPRQMANGINADLTTEGHARDQTIANFRALRACRFSEASLIKQEVRLHELSRADGQQSLAMERTWFNQEIAVAERWGVNMQKRDEQFQDATTELETKAPPRSASKTDPTRKAVTAATETNPDKRQVLASQVGQAKEQSTVQFSMDLSALRLLLSWPWLYA